MVNNSPYFYNTTGTTTQLSPQHHQPHTPQTPTSIPDIIFTGNCVLYLCIDLTVPVITNSDLLYV